MGSSQQTWQDMEPKPRKKIVIELTDDELVMLKSTIKARLHRIQGWLTEAQLKNKRLVKKNRPTTATEREIEIWSEQLKEKTELLKNITKQTTE